VKLLGKHPTTVSTHHATGHFKGKTPMGVNYR